MIYLASPYSHPDPAVRQQRFYAACAATAALMREGHTVFSPICHSHPLTAYGLPTDWSFWKRHDRAHLECCDEVVVLMLDGWEQSVGVQAELSLAGVLGKPVWYMSPAGTPTAPDDATTMRNRPDARTARCERVRRSLGAVEAPCP